ncbi:MAG TPA: hypothetical protein VMW52_01370 [Phycisphaerae bacterium]|nr:hypothetical protein [Phycisphaerae bacterium]
MALSANAPMKIETGDLNELPVADLERIYEGSMVGLQAADGYYRALVAGDHFVGHATGEANNSASAVNGAINVQVRQGKYKAQVTITSVAVTDIGKDVYASDDATLTLTKGTASRVGKVARYVTTNTCIVEFEAMPLKSGLLYSNAAASAEVENTTTETAFDTSYTIPASSLRVGDVIRVRCQGIVIDSNSTDTLGVKLYWGTEELCATDTPDVADNNIFYMDAEIVVRTIGSSGTIMASGNVSNIAAEATAVTKPWVIASATESTAAAIVVQAKATWSVAHAENEVQCEQFTVELLRN